MNIFNTLQNDMYKAMKERNKIRSTALRVALSKIKDFNKNEDKKVFISNKELSRGDIILNCDGMRYSEKSVHST